MLYRRVPGCLFFSNYFSFTFNLEHDFLNFSLFIKILCWIDKKGCWATCSVLNSFYLKISAVFVITQHFNKFLSNFQIKKIQLSYQIHYLLVLGVDKYLEDLKLFRNMHNLKISAEKGVKKPLEIFVFFFVFFNCKIRWLINIKTIGQYLQNRMLKDIGAFF